jgi:DNA replication protein DnaC
MDRINPKPDPDPQPLHACTVCGLERVEDCDNGWHFHDDGARRCVRFKRLLERRRTQHVLETLRQTWANVAPWEELDLSHRSWRLARALADRIAEVIADSLNLVFLGPRGTGKSNAAVLLGAAAMERGYTFAGIRLAKLGELVRDSYGSLELSERALMSAFRDSDLVLIDEVIGLEVGPDGKAFSRGHDLRLLDEILQSRYEEGKPTVLTANLTRRELEQALGERSAQRFFASCEEVLFNGPVYRLRVGQRRIAPLVESLHRAAGIERIERKS